MMGNLNHHQKKCLILTKIKKITLITTIPAPTRMKIVLKHLKKLKKRDEILKIFESNADLKSTTGANELVKSKFKQPKID